MSSSKKTVKKTVSKPVVDLHTFLYEDIKAGSKSAGQCYTVSFIADRYGISTSTVYNHLKQFHRDGIPIFKTPRGLVFGSDTTMVDQLKFGLRMSVRNMNTSIESNALCPVILKSWANTKGDNAITVLETAKALMGSTSTWTRRVHTLYNIVDSISSTKLAF